MVKDKMKASPVSIYSPLTLISEDTASLTLHSWKAVSAGDDRLVQSSFKNPVFLVLQATAVMTVSIHLKQSRPRGLSQSSATISPSLNPTVRFPEAECHVILFQNARKRGHYYHHRSESKVCWCTSVTSVLQRVKQENGNTETSLDYLVRPGLNSPKVSLIKGGRKKEIAEARVLPTIQLR